MKYLFLLILLYKIKIRERRKNKTKDSIPKKDGDIYYTNQINILLKQIKINNYLSSDIPFFIIKYFSEKNFRALTQNEIIKYISNPLLFPLFAKRNHLHEEIISALRNNVIFELNKKKIKYELNLKKCVNYLSLYQDKNKNTNSDSIENNISPDIITFPDNENNVVYFGSSGENHLNMSFIFDEDNIDNSFTFGENSQIITNTKKNINMEELENKALQKYIPDFEFVFDENKYFKSLGIVATEFLTAYKRVNSNEKNIKKLDESIQKINCIMDELNIKIDPFNKISSLFNEEKNELFNTNSVIHQQLKLLQIFVENDFLPIELYETEKGLYMGYQEEFKKLLNKLQVDFKEIKNMEQNINNNIFNLKKLLNEISKEFVLNINDNYRKFYNLIKDIDKSSSIPINVNINETVKLFYSYLDDFGNIFTKIEEKMNEKKKLNK